MWCSLLWTVNDCAASCLSPQPLWHCALDKWCLDMAVSFITAVYISQKLEMSDNERFTLFLGHFEILESIMVFNCSICLYRPLKTMCQIFYVFCDFYTFIFSSLKEYGNEWWFWKSGWAEDIIKCVEAICVLSLFKHRCLSSWTLRTLQGQTARSEEIKNKRVPDCHVCWDWALITLTLSCQDHDDDNCVLCPLTRIIEYPESWGRDPLGSWTVTSVPAQDEPQNYTVCLRVLSKHFLNCQSQ